ncbi:MAG: hypothetical protein WD049_03870 [Candidatus Paceibacterota bacterium]
MEMKQNQHQTVSLKELRENMENYIQRVNRGERFTVFRRSHPVFTLGPVDSAGNDGWETVVDFTTIRKGGVPLAQVKKAVAGLE